MTEHQIDEQHTGGRVRIGVERLCDDPSLAPGRRIGLVTNETGVLPDLSPTVPALRVAGIPIAALFGPEHGIRGSAQAGESERSEADPDTGLPVYDTYGRSEGALDDLVRASGVDTLLFDIADIGARFYTYIWTMHDLLATAARLGITFVVLDRPNPVCGALAEGPLLDPAYASFVGRQPIPVRHGLTVGELARHLNAAAIPELAGRSADLIVIPMTGWTRGMFGDETGLPWVMPSVNMPTLDTALAFSGTCLFEGTNLSEGRGTTRPFELIGAPYVDGRWAAALNERRLPGARLRHVSFVPTFHKYAGKTVQGTQLHVTDRSEFSPVRTAVTMLHVAAELYAGDFGWRLPKAGHRPFIDLLWGGSALRDTIDSGNDPAALVPAPCSPAEWAGSSALLYQ